MLTQIKGIIRLKLGFLILHEILPLLHQLQPLLFRRLFANPTSASKFTSQKSKLQLIPQQRTQHNHDNQSKTSTLTSINTGKSTALSTCSVNSHGSLDPNGPIPLIGSAHHLCCWHGTFLVLMMRWCGSTRKRARILRWPGFVVSRRWKGETQCCIMFGKVRRLLRDVKLRF